jgi:ribosomal-protein-alanine N-acetyltransferase
MDFDGVLTSRTSASIPPTLRVGECVLRPFRQEDAAAWHAYLSDPRVTENTSWPPITPEFVASVVARVLQEYQDRRSLRWALARGEDDVLIGSCGYNRWVGEGAAELAYDLAPGYWRRGLMSAAVRTVVDWAFETGMLRRVEALAMTTNAPSIALLERTGFKRERLLPGHRLARGVPRDFHLYAIEASGQ